MDSDIYLTIENEAAAVYRDKGSKFLSYAYPVKTEAEVKEIMDGLKKKYYDATHHCLAWRMGADGDATRAVDDGEPSGTAGRPILGQILSKGLTDILIVVVRYFGGTKLGVSGLINAYKESAAAVIDNCKIIEKTHDAVYELIFPYQAMNSVMKVVKDTEPKVRSQVFDNVCRMEIAIRKGRQSEIEGRLEKCEGAQFEFKGYE